MDNQIKAREYTGRREDTRLLTGRGAFTSDQNLPGQVHAVFVRADRAHATILSIDTEAAAAAPGVVGVFTHELLDDLGFNAPLVSGPLAPPKNSKGEPMFVPARTWLAKNRVRYVGEAVVLVAAETAEEAADAAELVMIDYEDLPVIVDVRQATAAGAFQVHEGAYGGNLAFRSQYGDRAAAEAVFAAAPLTVKVTLNSPRVAANPLEPRSCLAAYDAETDSFDLWAPNQGIATRRSTISAVTGRPSDRVRVHPRDVGGAFGVRGEAYAEYFACLAAARALNRPVKWTGTRSETIITDYQGRGVLMTGELALDNDGNFLAIKIKWLADMGAYLSSAGPYVRAIAPAGMAINSYRIPVVHGVNQLCFTNAAPTTAYRGAARPDATYLCESLVDHAARIHGFDPAELRRRNFIPREAFPYTTPTGSVYDSGDPEALLDLVLAKSDAANFASRRSESEARGKLRGRGLAAFFEPSGFPMVEQASIQFDADGRVVMNSVSGPSGQGHETVFPEVVADQLGLNPAEIVFEYGAPDTQLQGGPTGGSRSLVAVGGALRHAGEQVIKKGKALAAEALGVPTEDVDFDEGLFRHRSGNTSITLRELIKRQAGGESHPLDSLGAYSPPQAAWPSGVHVAEVEIDVETGVLEVVSYVGADDFGHIYNPVIVEGQVHGGIMQAVGQVMGEEIVYDPENGQILTGSFMDYFMPRAEHTFPLELVHHNVPSPTNPFGAKGVGEAGATGGVPTLANAVMNALATVGISHLDMPYTPNRLWHAIHEARAGTELRD